MKNNNSHFLEHLIYPIVVGAIVLLGQFLIQPWITDSEHKNAAKIDSKRAVYSQALTIVNQKFASVQWAGPDVPANYSAVELGNPPTPKDINDVYSQLVLISTPDIVRKYSRCLGLPGEKIEHAYRIELIELMREDLEFGKIDLPHKDVWFFAK